ncbi:unnamed protein product [Tilletia controversa]|uniref:Protein kinase domain-containing protein n=1 Tax=Tilletia controversa TaxID=13291 RepID=A0A8X7MU34_9BASI|nr:hypothetical protein A4X06_0g3443 [Tilletia controversa]CAD6948780.1 unnamed protein product [Tilletia controversa]CAD6971310.1 unnamed protein product [Tilletia controversa]
MSPAYGSLTGFHDPFSLSSAAERARYTPAGEDGAAHRVGLDPEHKHNTPAGEGDTGHRDDANAGSKRKAWVPSVIWRPHGWLRRVKAAPLLGRGAFASAHRAVDLLGGPERAVKRQEYTDRPSSRLVSKIRALSILKPHPGIVELLELCYSARVIDLVMPIYWGTLQDLLDTTQGRKLRLCTAKNLTHQILVAVTHIHKNGVVDLDIMPDNILLSNSGAVKISDFGLAVEAGTGQDMLTAGTVDYTAPEYLMGLSDHLRAAPDIVVQTGQLVASVLEPVLGGNQSRDRFSVETRTTVGAVQSRLSEYSLHR